MRSLWSFLLLSAVVLSACAPIGGQGRASKKNEQRDSSVVVSPAVVANGNKAAPAWLAYGIAKLALLEKAGAPPRKSVTDFDSEVAARTVMLEVWKETKAKDGGKDAYLDLLLAIHQAGFLREYVVAALARPGWTISGKELPSLRVADYLAWAEDHVPNHNVPTMVQVESRTIPQNPRVVGDSLPPPNRLSPERVPQPFSSASCFARPIASASLIRASLATASPLGVTDG